MGLYLAFVDVSMGRRRSFWVREGGDKERGGGVVLKRRRSPSINTCEGGHVNGSLKQSKGRIVKGRVSFSFPLFDTVNYLFLTC